MKLIFECKLTMYDYIPDDEVGRILTKEQVAESIAEYIKEGLSKTGGVSITDATLTKKDGGWDG